MRQPHGEIPNLKHRLLSSESIIRKLTWKINNLTLNNCYIKLFLQKKSEAKAIKTLVRCFAGWEKWYITLMFATLYKPYHKPKMGSGVQAIVKANELSSVMTVCRHGVQNGVMPYILKIEESTIRRIFVAWVAFIEAVISRLNLKPNDWFLPWWLRWCLRILMKLNMVS